MLERLRIFFFKWNLFDDGSTDATIIEYQRLATRIYLVTMFISLLFIGLVTLSMERSIIGHVSSPTQHNFRDLFLVYPFTLKCPCREISISYQSFAHIHYYLHQVCSSAFIADEWIRSISININHLEMSFFWQIIAGFCQLSQTSLETIVEQFHVDILLSPMVMDEDLLRTQTHAAFNTLLSSGRSLFFRNLLAIQRITTGNQFVSGLGTNINAHWGMVDSEPAPMLLIRNFDHCSCLNMDGCPRSSIEGIVSDCLMINGVLQSTFHCYFNQTCLAQLHPFVISSINTLHPEKNHQTNITSTVQELLQRFLLDQLIIEVDFTAYYRQCQPNYCSYSYRRRFNFAYALATMIGIFGGLNIVLRYLCRLIAKKISLRQIEPQQVNIISNTSVFVRMKKIRSTIWQTISTLNLFETRLANQEKVKRQRLTTRLFLFLIFIAVIVSGIYIFFSIQTQEITISNPSLKIYTELYQNYSSTLSCPCLHMSIPYKKFLMINYTHHQICSSTLVSSSWLEFILAYDPSVLGYSSMTGLDFRHVAPSYFQLLATICALIQNTFDDGLQVLKDSDYINQYLPSESRFLEHMSSINESITISIQQEFLNIQNWLSVITAQGQYLNVLSFNADLTANADNDIIKINEKSLSKLGSVTETTYSFKDVCTCIRYPTICQSVSFLDRVHDSQTYPLRFFVGMNAGCNPWLGLLWTDTSWWYRTDIIDQIRLLFGDHLRNQSNPIIMPLSNQTKTRFRYANGTHPRFENLIETALLEEWTGNLTRFDLFYHECAPKKCTYIIQSQRSHLAALLLLISICSGLNKLLRWSTLILLRIIFYIRNWCRQRRDQDEHVGGGWIRMGKSIRQSWIEMNLYRSTSTETRQIQCERQQSRFYICLLSISVVFLVIYTSLEERTLVQTINPPANSTHYTYLKQKYGDTLECPCSRISFEYNLLIPKLLVDSFHPVCDSSFVNSSLYDSVVLLLEREPVQNDQDFRRFLAPWLRLMNSLCSLARNQTSQSLLTFLSSSIVINRLISAEKFEQQLNNTLIQIQQQIPRQFTQTLDTIRLNQQGNALISGLSTNWQYRVENNNRSMGASIIRQPMTYENGTCSCALSQQCSTSAVMFDRNDNAYHTLNRIRFGCTILESLLQSSLECFYSEPCLDNTIDSMFVGHPMINPSFSNVSDLFKPLNNSLSTFADNDTMETIVKRMFINRWQHELSYQNFFQACGVRECTYTYYYRFDPLDVVTTCLSVFGGLSVALKFVVPHIFTIVKKIRPRR